MSRKMRTYGSPIPTDQYILYNLHSEGTITNLMQHSPSLEDGSSSASQEIPCLLRNSRVH